jgi:heterodisulfide reductase subunit B
MLGRQQQEMKKLKAPGKSSPTLHFSGLVGKSAHQPLSFLLGSDRIYSHP